MRTAEDVSLAGGLRLADLSDAVGSASFDYRVGAVPEFSLPMVDRGRVLARRDLLREGTVLTYGGYAWQVAAVERAYRGSDVWVTVTARSRLSRRLRTMTGRHVWEGQTPQQVLGSLVKRAGGRAVVEPGAGRMRIVQKRTENVLDLIGSLASDTGVEWVETSGVIYVGTPWWAYRGEPGLPVWPARADGGESVQAGALSVSEFTARSSLDDRGNAAEATMTVEAPGGCAVRPWHRVDVSRADDADNGMWLVSGVSWTEGTASVALDLQRPLKSSPKKASDGGGDAGLGPVLAGSSYSDAPRPSGWKGRGVASIVERYRANPGGLGYAIYNGCLWYAQEMAGYPHWGANPHVLWTMLPTARRRASRRVVPGAVLLYRNSRVGHATVYLGGGRVLGTDMDADGAFARGQWSIASADACEASFGTLLGWYVP